jgi:hypothetical protein
MYDSGLIGRSHARLNHISRTPAMKTAAVRAYCFSRLIAMVLDLIKNYR